MIDAAFPLTGRTALVAGGSRGIGAAFRARGGRAHAIATHMGRLDEIERLVQTLDARGLAGDFARELGPKGVRVNAISCGVIRTAMGDHTTNDPVRYADMMKINPLKRVGDPAEVADTALYLASDASRYTTGVILQVDGGVLS